MGQCAWDYYRKFVLLSSISNLLKNNRGLSVLKACFPTLRILDKTELQEGGRDKNRIQFILIWWTFCMKGIKETLCLPYSSVSNQKMIHSVLGKTYPFKQIIYGNPMSVIHNDSLPTCDHKRRILDKSGFCVCWCLSTVRMACMCIKDCMWADDRVLYSPHQC